VTYQAPLPVPQYTEPAIVTTRRHRGVVTVDKRCPAGMHWVASSRRVTKYQQGDRVVRVSKRKAGYCSR
jgi:predicted proteasome-type protease